MQSKESDNKLEEMKKRFPVPSGFRELLEALAKEVIRSQPNNIYEFCSLFFNFLLEKQAGKIIVINVQNGKINYSYFDIIRMAFW